jgi:hypothetical protein
VLTQDAEDFRMSDVASQSIIWPPEFEPARSPVFVRNTLSISAAPEVVWAWLTRAPLWPSYYANASNVVVPHGEALTSGMRFTWKTFGVSLVSNVREFVPNQRLAWDAKAIGVWAYHAWLIVPEGQGCTVITEETQHGFLARLGSMVFPRRMGHWHQLWLEGLQARARTGLPQ